MTIRNTTNWCPTCQEACHHHPTTCTVCGSLLQAPPLEDSNESSSNSGQGRDRNNNNHIGVSPIPESLREATRTASRDLRQMIASLREHREILDNIRRDQLDLAARVEQMRQEWQALPAALLDPQGAAAAAATRPTSKAFLNQIPRISLKDHSPLLYQATLLVNGTMEMEGILGDFECPTEAHTQVASLVIAQHPHRTGKGGRLDDETKALVQQQLRLDAASGERKKAGVIVLLERGDGITFVQKALLAQKAGATACIIANHVSEPWPYVMKDSKGEANKLGLAIPTVMIKKPDADRLYNMTASTTSTSKPAVLSVRLTVSQHSVRDCIICTDALCSGATALRLPPCGHLFHEECVVQWLNKHNTCPFCRRELPTDDEEYERDRRRAQRTHAGGTSVVDTAFNNFYG